MASIQSCDMCCPWGLTDVAVEHSHVAAEPSFPSTTATKSNQRTKQNWGLGVF